MKDIYIKEIQDFARCQLLVGKWNNIEIVMTLDYIHKRIRAAWPR